MAHRTPKFGRQRLHVDLYAGMSREESYVTDSPENETAVTRFQPAGSVEIFRKIGFSSFLQDTSTAMKARSVQPFGSVRERRAIYATATELARFDPDVLTQVMTEYDERLNQAQRNAGRLSLRAIVSAHLPGEHDFRGVADRVVLTARLLPSDSPSASQLRDERVQLRENLLGLPPTDEPWDVPIGCSKGVPNKRFLRVTQDMFPIKALGEMDFATTHVAAPDYQSLSEGLWIPPGR